MGPMNNETKGDNPYLTYSQNQFLKKRREKKELLGRVSAAGMPDSVKETIRILTSNPTQKATYVFKNHALNCSKEFVGTEFTEFDAIPNQGIIHGVITICEFDDRGVKVTERSEDIYMYQPRFEGRNRILIGPRFTQDGTFNNKAAYALKDVESGITYIGNIPKREIISNRVFDFDGSNKENFDASCRSIDITHRKANEVVFIKYDTDLRTGYIRTVDVNNEQELARLRAYVNKYRTPEIAVDMIDNLTHRIEKEVAKFEKITEEMEEAVASVGRARSANADRERRERQEQAVRAEEQALQEEREAAQRREDAIRRSNYINYGIRPTFASPIGDNDYGNSEPNLVPPPLPPEHGCRTRGR